MIRKYHNHKLQTNSWHCLEEAHNNHETSGRQTMQSYHSNIRDTSVIELTPTTASNIDLA